MGHSRRGLERLGALLPEQSLAGLKLSSSGRATSPQKPGNDISELASSAAASKSFAAESIQKAAMENTSLTPIVALLISMGLLGGLVF